MDREPAKPPSDLMSTSEFANARQKLGSQDQIRRWKQKVKDEIKTRQDQAQKLHNREKKDALRQQTKKVQQSIQQKSELIKMEKMLKRKEEE